MSTLSSQAGAPRAQIRELDGTTHLYGFRYLRLHLLKSRLAPVKESFLRGFYSLWRLFWRLHLCFCSFLLFVVEVSAKYLRDSNREVLSWYSFRSLSVNETNFVFSGKDSVEHQEMEQPHSQRSFRLKWPITMKFNQPSTLHRGGVRERVVQSFKSHAV